ncbi:MAG: hypothetical protein N2C14_30055, partial [Planctomycetales bacterium]
MRNKTCLLAAAGLLVSLALDASLEAASPVGELAKVSPSESRFRRPVAATLLDETTAAVANRRSGTLSVIDVDRLAVVAEFDFKGQPTHLVARGKNVLVTDAEHGRLVSLAMDRSSARVLWELSLPNHPVSVRVSQDGKWCSVGCMWGRKVVFVQLPKTPGKSSKTPKTNALPRIIATVDLPFPPREQLLLEDSSRLVVADAFGDQLAVINVDLHKVESIRALPAHNVRGLALSPDGQRILATHQIISELSPPRRSEIIWGVMSSDALRVIRTDKVLAPQARVMDGSRFIMIGNGTRGAGDPDALAVNQDGRAIIALAGVGEVAIIEPDGYSLKRIKVGQRPVDVCPLGDGGFLIVNELSDSITRLDLKTNPGNQAAKPIPTPKRYDQDKPAYEKTDDNQAGANQK